jgi:cell wall-associated NlpC family hydrolase
VQPGTRQGATLHHLTTLAAAGLALLVLLACGGGAAALSPTTNQTSGWACPSPTPKPYGEAGPVKEVIRHTRPITEGGNWDEEIFYEQWEQEYGTLGGPPFPAPTPYVVLGTNFTLGQRVRIPPLFAQVEARGGALQPDGRRLYRVTVTWINPTVASLSVDYGRQLQITGIATTGGGIISGAWSADREALGLAGVEALPTSIPTGESRVVVPILAPAGEIQTVALMVARDGSYQPVYDATPDPAVPTPTVARDVPTPTTNAELRGRAEDRVTVQFVSAEPVGPPCGDPGAITEWATDGFGYEGAANVPVAAPPGASRVVQIALNQVGRRYIWGAKGPYAFDCSGLMSWSYGQIGLTLPNGTANQWPRMRAIPAADLQPGDLVFFAISGGGIDHVGMVVGDLNGDGGWDMVHAASPSLGVRVDHNIFSSSYYAPRIRGFRTAR